MAERERQRIAVLGGGVAGLAAAYYLARDGHPVTVIEKAERVGGLCASFESHGFTLDHGPHKMYSVVPGILEELRRIMGTEILEHRKQNRIRLLGRYLSYPLSLPNLLPLLGPIRSVKMGLDFAFAFAASRWNGRAPSSYEEYVVARFGRSVYELVFEPLAWKVWGDPKTLSPELAAARIPSGGTAELVLRLLKLRSHTPEVDAPFFYYPRRGFGAFPERLQALAVENGGRVVTGAGVTGFQRKGDRITGVTIERGGAIETIPSELVVSSIPIHHVARLLRPGDRGLEEDLTGLKFRQLLLVYLFFEEDRILEDHWVFFPEREFPFNRLFEQKAMSPELGPAGRTAVCCDLTCDLYDELWRASDEELADRCHRAMVAAGVVRDGRLRASFVKRFRDFYPVYGIDYRERLGRIYERLWETENLVLTGRLGMFNYNNSDHCLDMGQFIAGGVREGREPRTIWSELESRVRTYRIID